MNPSLPVIIFRAVAFIALVLLVSCNVTWWLTVIGIGDGEVMLISMTLTGCTAFFGRTYIYRP